ncbi:O-antigen ligase family protein [Clostridium aminobutyricum]|uniref:O-antigen ligase family protein n=1 Tax=Clostridium aminobutyricum TaxID=33953 RepID=A0A939DAC8_CLOAM|nr:O-antigen ligase family protein [Clostridium aminobutyricum]MBN7774035.1 O-antigen ligase family protein [Clostridium aminobutyricum]
MTKKITIIPIASVILLMLFTTAAGSFDSLVQKWGALAGLILIAALMFTKQAKNALKVYTGPLFFMILAYLIWNGISICYADVPKAALFEFTKLIIAAAVFFTILVLAVPTKKGFGRVAATLTIVTSIFGIVSIDAASDGPLATGFKAFMGLFTSSMQHFGVLEQGIRITGIFGNANTFAGVIALGIFLCLYLIVSSEGAKERTLGIILLSIHALTYLLLFSLGSIVMFLIACILMILVTPKGERLQLFMLMAETVIVTLVCGAIVMRSFDNSFILPLMAIVLNAASLWAVDNYGRISISTKLAGNMKAGLAVGAIVLIIICGYVLAAIHVTGPMTLEPTETVMRAAYLEPGEYQLQAETEKAPTIKITSQDQTDLKVHTFTTIYDGTMDKASFNVPEGSKIVKLYFTGNEGGSLLKQVVCENVKTGTSEEVKLTYKLLPENVANRIQDLGANQNMVQRIVFFEDGLKLFRQSPVIGHGISGYEEGVASVQNFFYATLYVHNHYIQTLCDLGVIGFGLFIGILVACILSMLKLRKQGGLAFTTLPLFIACVFQIFGQAITDLTWSAGPFLIITFAIMSLLIIAQSKPFEKEVRDEEATDLVEKCAAEIYEDLNLKITGPAIAKVIIILLSLIMGILLVLNLFAHYKASTGNCTIDQIETLAKIDRFEADDYKTSYLVTVSTYGLQENLEQANKFAKEVTNNTDAVLNYVLPFYFNTGQDDKLFEAASIAAEDWKSSPKTWNNLFNIFDTAINPTRDNPIEILMHLVGKKEYYVDNILGYYRQLQERNATYLDDAMLDPSNVVFVGKMLGIENLDTQTLSTGIHIFSNTIFNSDFGVDVNNDGIPDNIIVLTGSTKWGLTTAESKNPKEPITKDFDGTVKIEKGTSFTLQTYCTKGGEYTLRLGGLKGLDGSALVKELSVSVDGQTLSVNYDENGAYVKATLKGAQAADEANGVTATAGSSETFTLNFPTGAQIEKITVTK